MKDLELRLISELMKNSRRSDRELARKLGVSQPTVSRTIERLRKRRVIREFTIIPDFVQLGYTIVAFTMVKGKSGRSQEEMERIRARIQEDMKEAPDEVVLFERGLGEGFTGIIVSFHDGYSSFQSLRNRMKEYPFLDSSGIVSFLVDLNDEIHYRYFTFSTLAHHVLTIHK
jgi:DNA-binding Lrp family transcriptional regulator